MISCTNKCIPEQQNKLNIYDLQNYEFFANFFQPKKKFVKFEFLIYAPRGLRAEILRFTTFELLIKELLGELLGEVLGMGGATIGSGGYKYPPLSKVSPPPGGYRGYKLVARGGTN